MKMAPVLGALIVLLAGGSFLVARSQSSQVTASGVRHAKSRVGVPINSLIQGEEKTLILERDATAPLEVEPPRGMSPLEWYTKLADYVLIVHVDAVTPTLTPDAHWITSTVSAKVKQVIKNKDSVPPISPGDIVSFAQQSGEMDVNGVHVRAVLPWAESFKPEKDYMIFAKKTENDNTLLVGETNAYEVTATSTLMPLARKGKARQEMDVPLNDAAARIHAAPPAERQ